MRILEVVTFLLVAVIAGTFVFEIVLAEPAWGQSVLRSVFVPFLDRTDWGGKLYIAIQHDRRREPSCRTTSICTLL